MSQYIQLQFDQLSKEQSEILIAQLSNEGFEGFEEEEAGLKAFIASDAFDEEVITVIAAQWKASFVKTIIAETNWNELWESNFPPVVVNDFVAVRAHFHEPVMNVAHEIIITPKMSFGTGHHATTYMMMEQMALIDFAGQDVFDFGTGTGVLAILAEKLGAAKIDATDIDEWSITNAQENIARNECSKIGILKADSAVMNRKYAIILANINKNVLLDNFETLAMQLEETGILLISGVLAEDESDMIDAAAGQGLRLWGKSEYRNWLCMKFSR